MPVEIHRRRQIYWDELEALRADLTRKAILSSGQHYLLLSEPNATYTGGKRAEARELLLPENEAGEAQVRRATRGGRWTYHGPGQILIYPIFRLVDCGFPSRGVRPFLHRLGDALTEWLSGHGIDARTGEPFGLYVGPKKIAAFGLSLERGVISHGVALYLTPQHEAFAHIHPCGVPGQQTTSLFECGVRLSWDAVSAQIVETLKKSFLPDSDWAYNVGDLLPTHTA